MKPMSFTYSGTVGSPIDRVFELITDAARMVEWLPGCRKVTPSPNRTGKGARHKIEFQRKGKRVDSEIEILEYTPPTGYGWVEVRGRKGSKTFFALRFEGGATLVTMKYVFTPAGLRAWLNAHVYRRHHAHRMFDSLLQNVRKALMK